jgi:hypothetical protein
MLVSFLNTASGVYFINSRQMAASITSGGPIFASVCAPGANCAAVQALLGGLAVDFPDQVRKVDCSSEQQLCADHGGGASLAMFSATHPGGLAYQGPLEIGSAREFLHTQLQQRQQQPLPPPADPAAADGGSHGGLAASPASPSAGASAFDAEFWVAVNAGVTSSFTVRFLPDWAPRAVARARALVGAGVFVQSRFHRVVTDKNGQRLAAFGLPADPAEGRRWAARARKEAGAIAGAGGGVGLRRGLAADGVRRPPFPAGTVALMRDSHPAAAADGENAPPGGDMEGPGLGLYTTQLCVFLSEYAPSAAEDMARRFVPVGEVQHGPAGAGMRALAGLFAG